MPPARAANGRQLSANAALRPRALARSRASDARYAARGGGGGFGGLGGGGLGGRGAFSSWSSPSSFAPIFLCLRVSAGVPGKLQPPQPRQRLRQTIRDHESTLGHHKKLPARK